MILEYLSASFNLNPTLFMLRDHTTTMTTEGWLLHQCNLSTLSSEHLIFTTTQCRQIDRVEREGNHQYSQESYRVGDVSGLVEYLNKLK